MIKLQTFTKAEWIARDHGLTVLIACPTPVPHGVPLRDHWGNYVTATTGYIGTADQAGTLPKHLAYGRLVHSISQQTCPVSDVLIDIAEQLEMVRSFPTRKALEDYTIDRVGFGRCSKETLDEAINDWHNAKAVADRAKACLPGTVIDALDSLLD
jgi:hypothetical protein